MCLHHEIQDCIDDGTIHLNVNKQNYSKYVAKANNKLQIYINLYPSYSKILVTKSYASFELVPSKYVNMVLFMRIPPLEKCVCYTKHTIYIT